jgi:hypothetical protein
VRRPIRKRDLVRRIKALEARLETPTPAPLDGQQTLDLAPPGPRITVPTLPGMDEAGLQRGAADLKEQR